jgi:hypothetical protein
MIALNVNYYALINSKLNAFLACTKYITLIVQKHLPTIQLYQEQIVSDTQMKAIIIITSDKPVVWCQVVSSDG